MQGDGGVVVLCWVVLVAALVPFVVGLRQGRFLHEAWMLCPFFVVTALVVPTLALTAMATNTHADDLGALVATILFFCVGLVVGAVCTVVACCVSPGGCCDLRPAVAVPPYVQLGVVPVVEARPVPLGEPKL